MASIPSLRQLRILTDQLTGEIYLCQVGNKDRNRVVDKINITDEALVAAIQRLCHGHGREVSTFATIRMPSGNYRIYVREISDQEADKFYEQHKRDEDIHGI
ncbi:hypothetical protein NAD41_002385 [Salmonella enterica]|nr:hypothetical protein [Salmonella enterica]EKK6596353.1 hypothetical protein [Salmonella enterica]